MADIQEVKVNDIGVVNQEAITYGCVIDFHDCCIFFLVAGNVW